MAVTKRKPGRPADGSEPRSERIFLRTTPGAMKVIRSALRPDETLSGFVRGAIEKEVKARRGR